MNTPALRPTVFAAALLAGACAPYPQRIHHEPVLTTADRVPEAAAPAGVSATLPRADTPIPTFEATAAAQALIAQGDELVANGQYDAALDRYDRASVLVPNQPLVDYKIGRLLDLQMQPREAAMRYRKFLHAMELERIQAKGDAAAKLAEAIAIAQQRLVVIDKR